MTQTMNMIADMPNDLQKWEAKRRLGKAKFILLHGVLGWGVPCGILVTVIRFLIHEWKFDAISAGISLVIWAIGGIFFGWQMWQRAETKYQNFLASKINAA